MKATLARLGLVLLLPLLAAASDAAPASLSPASKWEVNFGEAQCTASRTYGQGDGQVFLAVTPSPFGEVTQIAVARKGSQGLANQRPFRIDLAGQPSISTTALVFGARSDDNKRMLTFRANLAAEAFAQIENAPHMRVDAGTLDVTLALDQLPAVVRTLKKCIEQVRNAWNIGPHESRLKLPPHSIKSLNSAFESGDYPADALRKGQGGSVTLALFVDEAGKLAECSVFATSGVALLDFQACAMVQKNAKFAPAVGQDGRPAKGGMCQRIRWVVED